MAEVTQKMIDVAQLVFEEWLYEELGLDMGMVEAEQIVRRILVAAMLASNGS